MGCGDEKLSKYLTQTFTAHCNAMICQQVTLLGDAEWPKVADAVIEAKIDIESLLDFQPAMYWCPSCFGLITDLNRNSLQNCSHCGVLYEINPLSEIEDLIWHTKRLGIVCRNFRVETPSYSPLCALFEALSKARAFIHFTSFNMSDMMLGALKIISQKVQVCGIVSNPSD